MRRGASVLVGLFICAFTAAAALPSPVGASAPPRLKATTPSRASATIPTSQGWSRTTSSTVTPHVVNVSRLAAAARGGRHSALSLPLLVRDPAAYAAAKKSPTGIAGQVIPRPSTAPQATAFSNTFAGINSARNQTVSGFLVEPPDTQMAAGATRLLEMVNITGAVYDKAGNPVGSAFPLRPFFDIPNTFNPTDPRVLYDATTGRWYASMLAFDSASDSGVVLAVSQTSDPSGNWNVYSPLFFQVGQICDQPKLGYSSDKFVIGCSNFNATPTFTGAVIVVADKSQGLAGVAMSFSNTAPNTSLFGLVPAQILGSGATAYVVFNENPIGTHAAGLITITGPASAPTISSPTPIAMNVTLPPPAAPQNGSANSIDSGDDRFMSAVVEGGVLSTSGGESCTPSGDTAPRACLRLVQIGLAGSTLVQATTAGIVGKYMVNPTIGLDSSGNIVIEYTMSSATDYADIEVAIQPATTPGSFVPGAQLVAGTGPYIGFRSQGRWGDYGAVAVDPSDPTKLWVAGEYSNGPADGLGTNPSWGTYIGELAGSVCPLVGMIPTPGSPQGPSVSITLTAQATCATGFAPEYQFWIQPPSGTWTMVQDYSSTTTYPWTNHVTLGIYNLQVDVRASGETASYDSFLRIPYTITAAPCTTPTLTASVPSPQVAGTPVTLTATNTTCGAPPPLYQFWVLPPTGGWTMVQDYSSTATYNWNSHNTQVGNYVLNVHVKNTGSLGAYDSYTTIAYQLVLCNMPTLVTSPATSPYVSGSGAITLTATGSCFPSTQYQFFYQDASSVWHVIGSGYGSSSTAAWTADYPAGAYNLDVQIRPAGSSVGYVTYKVIPFALTGCGAPAVAPDIASPQVAGTTVTWTATVSCTGAPQYQFWVYSPVSGWSMAQDFGANGGANTFAWHSPTTAGTYYVAVRVRNTGANHDLYDNYKSVGYTLIVCNTPTLSTAPATSPYASGSGAITLTATGSCAGSTQYQFFYQDTSSVWHLIGSGYSSSSTASWPADYTAGVYHLDVQIKPTGSSASYVTYTVIPFTLTGCLVPTLTPQPGSPQPRNTTVTWTAGVTCSGTPQFQFWVEAPGGPWVMVQDYGANGGAPTYVWSSHAAPGIYNVAVRVRNAGAIHDPYDNYKAMPYTFT